MNSKFFFLFQPRRMGHIEALAQTIERITRTHKEKNMLYMWKSENTGLSLHFQQV